jgi:hypothetical protein
MAESQAKALKVHIAFCLSLRNPRLCTQGMLDRKDVCLDVGRASYEVW